MEEQRNCQSLVTRILDLEEIDEDVFRGRSVLRPLNNRVFGGQVIGQALHAASKTVPTPFMVHSLHAYFIRPGDPERPILYLVSRTRNGKSFTNRSVRAVQKGEAIFHLMASFQRPEEGLEHQSSSCPPAPRPEGLLTIRQTQMKYAEDPRVPSKIRDQLKVIADTPIPIDVRYCNPVDYLNPIKREPNQLIWMKAVGALSDDQRVHQMVAAYCSDYSLVGTLLLPHGITPSDPRLYSTSLDHCMYFHHPFRTDEWLLYDLNTTITSKGRGLAFGRFFDSKGTLVCSTVQEGLVRLRHKIPRTITPGSSSDENKAKL